MNFAVNSLGILLHKDSLVCYAVNSNTQLSLSTTGMVHVVFVVLMMSSLVIYRSLFFIIHLFIMH